MNAESSVLELLKALASHTSLQALSYLKKHRSAKVGDIAEGIFRSSSTVSRCLAKLEDVGILERARRGNDIFYRFSLKQEKVVKEVLRMV